MAEEGSITDALKKPPFANYDIVVYFGAGLFLVPFLNRYLMEPSGAKWPGFDIAVGSQIAKEAVSILALLFFIYIAGHIIAFLSSEFIEQALNRLLGKTSSSILLSSIAKPESRDRAIRTMIRNRISSVRRQKALFPTIVRALFHLPALLLYITIYLTGTFGYYETRVPPSTIDAARKKVRTIDALDDLISLKSRWYKPLEYYVINKVPSAVPRMYNYLVISGLFRSVSFVFLLNCWFVIIHSLFYLFYGRWLIHPFLGYDGRFARISEFFSMLTLYSFCLFSYLKFQRRYAEEAIFAFVFSD